MLLPRQGWEEWANSSWEYTAYDGEALLQILREGSDITYLNAFESRVELTDNQVRTYLPILEQVNATIQRRCGVRRLREKGKVERW